MNKPYSILLAAIMLPFAFQSCQEKDPIVFPETIEGWAPVYTDGGTARVIRSSAARDVEQGGKIYLKGKTLYQVETNKGIHVTDISQPSSPQKLKFIEIAGCQEVSIMNNYLYANNVNDLVILNIQDINNVTEAGRIIGSFHMVDPAHPPGGGYFECVDASKGEVIAWEQKTLHHPRCRQ